MLKDEIEDKIQVMLVGSLDESLKSVDLMIGFSVIKGDRSCFLPIGNKSEAGEKIDEHGEDALVCFLDTLLNSNDEVAVEISEIIRGLEEGIILNGDPISIQMIETALVEIGERD